MVDFELVFGFRKRRKSKQQRDDFISAISAQTHLNPAFSLAAGQSAERCSQLRQEDPIPVYRYRILGLQSPI
jgi:hypothetical protein